MSGNVWQAVVVVARKRKRCPGCRSMIEVGETAVLTDDRYMDAQIQWHGRRYQRGAWHSWHPACHDRERGEQAPRSMTLGEDGA
jgi:hypothetical protein